MKSKHLYLILFLAAVSIRLWINFRTSLPGINGYYYPIQIREILNSGSLAIEDMPLLFYVYAILVKIVSFIVPNYDIEKLIILIPKLIDSISLPLILIPLFLIKHRLLKVKLPFLFNLSVASLLTLSYTPLYMTSEAQKNAVGLLLMLFFIYYFLSFLKKKERKYIFIALLVFIILALTHFGIFFISLCLLITALIIFYKKKAIIPILILFGLSFLMVFIFDADRAYRMLFLINEIFILGISLKLIFYYHFGLAMLLMTYGLIVVAFVILKRHKSDMPDFERKAIQLFAVVLILLSLPFYSFEYGRRLGLTLFIPQVVMLVFLYPRLKKRAVVTLSIITLLFVSVSMIGEISDPKPSAITDDAYEDMIGISEIIEQPEKTIIFTRHDIEWLIVWELKTKVALPHIQADDEILEKYSQILFLKQKTGRNRLYPGRESPFKDPEIPEHSQLIYESEYFELYELKSGS